MIASLNAASENVSSTSLTVSSARPPGSSENADSEAPPPSYGEACKF